MAFKGTLVWICSLAVVSSTAAQDDTLLKNCSSEAQQLELLSNGLKEAAECSGDGLPSVWTTQQSAKLLLSVRTLDEILYKHQLTGCNGAKPNKCPAPEVPANGGLVCVTVANKRYCKPLCNSGYDFDFLRRSRLFEECSERTQYKWQTQYVGGNKLANCIEASVQISGAPSAYYPQNCLTTKYSNESSIIQEAITELRKQNIVGPSENPCLVCG